MKAISSFIQNKILNPVVSQLRQGITPEKISLTVALGVTVGIFPIIGSTAILCFLIAFILKLNHPTIQITNFLVYPLQIPLVPVFVRLGEKIFRATPFSFSVFVLKDELTKSPAEFMQRFGLAGLHAVTAWILIAPFVIPALYFSFLPALKRISPGSIDVG